MKGAIFNIFEDFVIKNHGVEAYEALLDNTELQTKEPYISAGNYPDSDFYNLVGTACKMLNISGEVAQKVFGQYTFHQLAESHPEFILGFKDAKAFLLTVDGVIHKEIKKLHPDAYLPKFYYNDPQPDELEITYISKRKLYHFMSGLIVGVANHFKQEIAQCQKEIIYEGNDACIFYLKFK